MIGDELAKDLDALIAEAKAQPPVTAPTPERRVGEEQLIAAASRQWWGLADDLIRDLARDLVDERAANVRLTAEVERLTKEKAEATGSVRFERSGDGVSIIDERGRLAVYVCRDDLSGLAALIAAALSLPTPAPEATEEERNFAARQPFLGCRKDTREGTDAS